MELQGSGNPVRLRIHRRVLAGLEREGTEEFHGIALGSASADSDEVVVEDFAPVGPEGEEEFARRGRHSLPSVGYFRVVPDGQLHMTPADRELFGRYFADSRDIAILFQLEKGNVRLVRAFVKSNGHLQEFGSKEAPPHPVIPMRTFPARASVSQPAERPEPNLVFRRYVLPFLALIVGVLLGMAAYLGLHRRSTAPNLPAASGPLSPPPAVKTAPSRTSPTGPSPSEADRAVDPTTSGGPQNRAEVQRQIQALLTRWADSLRSEDVDTYVGLYARTVSPYFVRNRVSRAQVRDEVERMLDRYGGVTTYAISDINIAPVDGTHAIAHFRKRWETAEERNSPVRRGSN